MPLLPNDGAELKLLQRFICGRPKRLGQFRRGDARVSTALVRWIRRFEDYDAYDALLSNFTTFEGREHVLARGRKLFAGPLTAHWED